jgi:hypothetical protein
VGTLPLITVAAAIPRRTEYATLRQFNSLLYVLVPLVTIAAGTGGF